MNPFKPDWAILNHKWTKISIEPSTKRYLLQFLSVVWLDIPKTKIEELINMILAIETSLKLANSKSSNLIIETRVFENQSLFLLCPCLYLLAHLIFIYIHMNIHTNILLNSQTHIRKFTYIYKILSLDNENQSAIFQHLIPANYEKHVQICKQVDQ